MTRTAQAPQDRDRRDRSRHTIGAVGRARRIGASPRDVFAVASTDVSHTGMQLHVPADVGLMVARGDRLEVVFPGEPPDGPLAVTGMVRWDGPEPWGSPVLRTDAAPEEELWRVGIRFEDAPADVARELLRRGGREPEAPPEG